MTNDTKRSDASAGETPDPGQGGLDPAEQTGNASTSTGARATSGSDAEIAALTAEVADLKDRLLRAHAEMDNVRKRADREKAETHKYAVTKFARDVVTIGDNVERAIQAVPAQAVELDPALGSLLEGVRMTERELINVLDRHGIKRMTPHGEMFNPHQHQAVMESQNESVPAGSVLQVLQAGYMIEDRVLRPAMVVVAKGGAKPGRADAATATPDGRLPANDDASAEGKAETDTASPNGQGGT